MSAGLNIGTGHAAAQTTWRSFLTQEAERQTYAMKFMGEEEGSMLQLINDLSKNRGDSVQLRFSPTDDSHDGFGEGETVRGNELSTSLKTDSLKIGVLKQAYAQDGPMDQQRINVNLKKMAFYDLRTWWSRRWDETVFNQLCGYTPLSMGLFKRCGMNAVPSTDTNHHIFATGSADETVGADDTAIMSLDWINEALLRAQSKSKLSYPIAPCSDGFYHLFVHPYQWEQLRTNTNTGQWNDIMRAVLEGGKKYEDSAQARGWLGVYNGTKIHVSDYIPNGVNSGDSTSAVGTVRRAVFCGANAGSFAFGEDFATGDHLSWIEQVDDYTTYGILAQSVFGFKVNRYESSAATPVDENYGAIVISTYADS